MTDSQYVDLSKDDEEARRLLSLAVEFMNARDGLRSSYLRETIYAGKSQDTYRKTFSRDRATLAVCGIVVKRERTREGDFLWRVDEHASYAHGAELDTRDALALDIACLPLLDDPTFPYRDDLRIALAKIDRAFVDAGAPLRAAPARDDRVLSAVRTCLASSHAARICYRDAAGNHSERVVAPYGLFGLRGELYLVGPRLDDAGQVVEDSMRTYRVSRMEKVQELHDVAYEVPADFCVADYRKLPFQLGPTRFVATFEVPAKAVAELPSVSLGRGQVQRDGNKVLWLVDVSDTSGAASWAVAQGLVPVGPGELVDAWKSVLEGVLNGR